jgi:type VI secretion system protein ImpL
MKKVASVLFHRWVLIGIGMLAFIILIWWVGPTISISNFRPLETEWARWINISIIVLMPLLRVIWRAVKARRANALLTRGLVQAGPAPDPSAGEAAQLRQRFEQALALLRKRRFGSDRPSLWARLRAVGSRQYLYDLPWYAFIGAPGAGKTTALINSGLRFPLADRLGREPVRGVGGTRNCDWWFTDEAVFLDTAGRYTTQQSDQQVDAGAWKSFLQLLKKSRPRRPINGVMVTVSVADLLQQSSAEQDTHAAALRARVQELYQELGVRIPIYVLVTKSDLLAGFGEFFGSLGKDERAQVWGFSLPFGKDDLDAAAMSAELARLEQRLYDRLPERLEEERDPARRALLYGFPQQFALLRDRLVHFTEAAFAPTRFETVPLLRGLYFASGTQEGSPIDRVMGALARSLRLGHKLLPAQQPSGRSYFLTRLLRDVVFPEAGLAGLDVRWERRRQWIQVGAIAAAAVTVVLIPIAWWISAAHNRTYLADVASQFEDVKKQVTAVRAGARNDLAVLLPTLTSVRALSETRATADGSVPWSWRFGLYQGGKLETAGDAAYQRMLEDTFLPSLTTYLEGYLRNEVAGSPEEAYDALKTYVMLYDAKHFKRDAAWSWYQGRGEQLVARIDSDGQRALKAHFDALYERGWVDPIVGRNDALVARVRTVVSRDALPNRIYRRLIREPMADVRDFTIAEKAGPKALLVFERGSGAPLTRGVPALYTKDGYYKHFAKRVELATLELADEETWVLGTGGSTIAAAAASARTADAVKRLYLEAYRRTWRAFINDITVVRNRDLEKTIEIARVLSSADTPLKSLMKAIDRETSLSVPPEKDTGVVGVVTGKAHDLAGKAGRVLGGTSDSLEKTLVDDNFDDVRRFVGGPGGNAPSPLDGMVQLMADLYQMLAAAQEALKRGVRAPASDMANKLRAEANRQPEPMRSMLQGLVEGGTQLELRTVRNQLSTDLRTEVGDFCVKAINGRYPFVRTANEDVTPEDFARLFAPGGLLDSFFQRHLAQYADTSRRPWRFKDPAMGQSGTLAEFQRAQIIRDVFFRSGGNTPSIQLEFKPLEMDAAIQQFVLDVDGRIVRYAHGPQVPVRVQFPGPGGRSQVRVFILPPPSSGSTGVKFDGPWALFRMFDGIQIDESQQTERFVATISIEGRRAVFEMLASSVRNPFRLPELSQFHCPTAL